MSNGRPGYSNGSVKWSNLVVGLVTAAFMAWATVMSYIGNEIRHDINALADAQYDTRSQLIDFMLNAERRQTRMEERLRSVEEKLQTLEAH